MVNDTNANVSVYSDGNYIDIYTIDVNTFGDLYHTPTILGLVIGKTNIVGTEQIGRRLTLTIYNNVKISNVYDKKISFIGDSISNDSTDNEGGYVQKTVEYLQKNYPNSVLVLGTPIKCENEETNNTYLKERRDAILDLGYYYNIQVIDLYSESGIESTNADLTLKDGTHPTIYGYELMADIMVQELQKVSF